MNFEGSKIIILIKGRLLSLALCLIVGFSFIGFSDNARACTNCLATAIAADPVVWFEAQMEFDEYLDREFARVQSFVIHELWEQNVLPAMMLATEQMSVVALQQAMAVGMLIDAESQLDAQRLLQEIRAKAHKDYHPSIGMCTFGSVMKNLAAVERKGEIATIALSQRSQDRQLGQRDTSGMHGNDLDKNPRLDQFKAIFCNEKDRDSVLAAICTDVLWSDPAFDAAARERMNKDIDYFSALDSPWTVDMDFTNALDMDAEEEHLLAMGSNLYAHDTFPRVPTKLLQNKPGHELTVTQKAYMDMRSIIAKRSVAENSFYAIAAMKAEGDGLETGVGGVDPPPPPVLGGGGGGPCGVGNGGNSCAGGGGGGFGGGGSGFGGPPPPPPPPPTPFEGVFTNPLNSKGYMEFILQELGVTAAEATMLLGENPSYYAQMEILTKKIYQNPSFYINLYDKPANVERKDVAMQAIKLMQKFDILKSFLRGEASVSILLELAVIDLQTEVEDQIQAIKSGDR